MVVCAIMHKDDWLLNVCIFRIIAVLLCISSTLRHIVLDKKNLAWQKCQGRGHPEPHCGCGTNSRSVALWGHLKHCNRSPRAKQPAWYSFPSMTEGTVSVSSTMTAISLSRFPSMLRSLMLAEPKRRNNRSRQLLLTATANGWPLPMLPYSQHPNFVKDI